jgi:hypothetical protein
MIMSFMSCLTGFPLIMPNDFTSFFILKRPMSFFLPASGWVVFFHPGLFNKSSGLAGRVGSTLPFFRTA